MKELAVKTESLWKHYGKKRPLTKVLLDPLGWREEKVLALKELTLEVDYGEIFGLLGPNGAGKTTLVKILCTMVLPDSGRAWVGGEDIRRSVYKIREKIGFVTSDERSFYLRLNGVQNLEFFAALHGFPREEGRRRAEELLSFLGMEEEGGKPFMDYSSGMKQRLALARGLIHEPEILFLDEPTRSLDPVSAERIRDFIKEKLNREMGKTIFLATHNLTEAKSLCTSVSFISSGEILKVGKTADLLKGSTEETRYFIRFDGGGDLEALAPPSGRIVGEGENRACEVAPGEDLDGTLRFLISSGVRILSISEEGESLESVFKRIVGEG